MTKSKTGRSRARYTLEFKQEAVRLVEGGQSIAGAARTLGVVDQTLFNWVKASRAGKCVFRPNVTARFGNVTGHFGHRDRQWISGHRDRPFRYRDRPFRRS